MPRLSQGIRPRSWWSQWRARWMSLESRIGERASMACQHGDALAVDATCPTLAQRYYQGILKQWPVERGIVVMDIRRMARLFRLRSGPFALSHTPMVHHLCHLPLPLGMSQLAVCSNAINPRDDLVRDGYHWIVYDAKCSESVARIRQTLAANIRWLKEHPTSTQYLRSGWLVDKPHLCWPTVHGDQGNGVETVAQLQALNVHVVLGFEPAQSTDARRLMEACEAHYAHPDYDE
ncbi:hypothetical protein AB6D11_01020 [Vibrio splendidus]